MSLRQPISALIALSFMAAVCSCGSSNTSHLLYVSTGEGIYGYRIDKSGNSSVLPSAPFTLGNSPAGMVIDSSGHRAYVANQQDNTISLVKIDTASGVLSEVLPRTAAGGFSPNALLLDSSGTTLYSVNELSNDVSIFSVGSNGALTLTSTASVPASAANIAVASNLMFVAVPNFSRVYTFSISSGTATAVTNPPLFVAEGVGTVTVDPSAKFLYVTNPSNNTIAGYSIHSSGTNSITFSPIPGSPFAPSTATIGTTPQTPVSAILDSTATHLYVANAGTANLSLFSIGTDGALTSMTPATVAVGTSPQLLAFDTIGKYLLVGNIGAKSVTQLTVSSNGNLTSSGHTINTPTVPRALAVTK